MSPSEVVPRFIREIYRVRPDLKVTRTAIHKILFEVKATLPENDPERGYLPFYWYKYGPYSEVVESSLDSMKRQGVLREEKTETGKTLLVLNASPGDPGSVCEDGLSAVVGRIVRGIDPYRIGTFVDRIYWDYAPYEFMPRYKVDFLPGFEGCLASRLEGQRTLSQWSLCDPETPDIDRLEDALYMCEAALVEDPLFRDFNDEFVAYASGAGKAFDIARMDESIMRPVILATQAVALEIWYTFAGGVRILEGGHDDYYNGRLGRWEQEYRKTLSALAPMVSTYTGYIRESAGRIPSREPDERRKRILSSLIEGYFSI
ncbi:MAG: hypothetical protein GX882_07395 [Methanomicrobiales archaeon]|nr:hypothetical protein [Methanomicrobiales archaeon]